MATTVTHVANGAWSDLGTGNRQIQALDFDVYVALGAVRSGHNRDRLCSDSRQ
jgi:hypothetical protein